MFYNGKQSFFLLFFLFLFPSLLYAEEELLWFLGASMNKPGKEVIKLFHSEKHPFKVILIPGGSGQLLSKIKSAHKGDIYTPAGEFFCQKAIKEKIVLKKYPFLRQTPVFALSSQKRKKIKTLEELSQGNIRIALGNPKTMALGVIYQDMEKKFPKILAQKIQEQKLVEGLNISQIVNYLKTGIVDAAILFDTTAQANGFSYISIPEKYNHREIIYLLQLSCTSYPHYGEEIIRFLLQHRDVFQKYGFLPVKKAQL